MRFIFQDKGHKGPGEKGWVLGIKSPDHYGYELATNPLVYPLHATQTPEYKHSASIASNLSEATISRSNSRRILDQEEPGLSITSQQFYNLGSGSLRKKVVNRYDDESIHGLLVALDTARFVYRTRLSKTTGESGVVRKKSLSIF